MDIACQRLHNQRIEPAAFTTPAEAVAWFGAVQAQDYLGALWAVGLRMREATERSVEAALTERRIVRTWPLRGTLHFVAAADVHWMLELATPRVLERSRRRLHDEFGLDDPVFAGARKVIERALRGGRQLTRPALYQVLESARISAEGQRGLHILWWLAQQGVICHGTREGKQPTFVLLDEWLPAAKRFSREEALAELALRYFTSRGPATPQDFTWWSGLAAADARIALEIVQPQLLRETRGGSTYWRSTSALPNPALKSSVVHLLPAYDEYAIAYKDRGHVLSPAHSAKAGNGIFNPVIVVDGHIAGTWKRTLGRASVAVAPSPFVAFDKASGKALEGAAHRYAAFVGLSAAMTEPVASVKPRKPPKGAGERSL
ncbi:winged helix DNA-binding domain-containing protein [Dokdonella soli]|uniref:Winged helix DNA-binding domain-containing protein n=1 Tax=Dokdonella soli TaxID=529810 RepID=A0ABN1IVP7_9GAMM